MPGPNETSPPPSDSPDAAPDIAAPEQAQGEARERMPAERGDSTEPTEPTETTETIDREDYFAKSFSEPEEDPGDAIQVAEPAALDVGQQASFGRKVGEGHPRWAVAPGSTQEAEAQYFRAKDYCETRCPIYKRCAEEACAVYRSEKRAVAYFEKGALDEGSSPTPIDHPDDHVMEAAV